MPPPYDDALQVGNYRQANQANTYATVQGIAVMGCSDGAPVLIRTIRPYGIRNQTFEYTKDRTPPIYPAPCPNNLDSTLVGESIAVPLPSPIPGPVPAWRFAVSGQYTYVEITPTNSSTGLPGAKMPVTFPTLFAQVDQLVFAPGGIAIMDRPPDLNEPNTMWPFTAIGQKFADHTLSQTWNVHPSTGVRTYTPDNLRRG